MSREGAVVVRALSVLLAVAACAWFVLGIRQATDTARATAILSGAEPLNEAQAHHANSLLHAAGFLNPDTQVDLLRADLVGALGNRRRAQAISWSVIRKEPMNVEAWFTLAREATDYRTVFFALGHVKRLDPKIRPGAA